MALIFVTKDFAVDPNEVATLEAFEHWKHDPSPSGSSHLDHTGTIVIQKNGRKTYVKDLTPSEVHDLIFGKVVSPKKANASTASPVERSFTGCLKRFTGKLRAWR